MYNKYFYKNNILNNILCNLPCKFPLYNGHYLTGKDLSIFSKFLTIENQLTNITCSCNNLCNNLKNKFKR